MAEKFVLRIGNLVLETTRVFPVVLSIVVITVSAMGFLLVREGAFTTIEISPRTVAVTPDLEFVTRIESLEERVSTITSSMENAASDRLAQVGVGNLEKDLAQISNDLTSLKEIIVDNPEKALAIPLLRREIDELQRRQEKLAVSTKDQIDRIYDFSKWFLGLMITLAIGLVTMGFVRRPKPEP